MLFHFQVRTESHILLSDASELDGLEEARIEAARRVGELLQKHARLIWTDENWHMDVTDDVGLILFSLEISALRSAATQDWAPPSS